MWKETCYWLYSRNSYFGLEGSGHFNFFLFISKLVDFKFLFTDLFLVQKLETLMEWNRKIFRANFHVLNHIFSHFFTFHSYFLDMITYSIVASTNTCYYSENKIFCFLKSRILTCQFFF